MSSNTPPSAICGFCSGLYVDPRLLPCLHTFCAKCLKKISEEQGSKDSLKCPTCQKRATLPEGGSDTIQKDIRRSHEADVARLASRMQSEEKKSCDLCVNNSTGPAVSFCHDCSNFLCKPCSDYHKICRMFLNHKLESVGRSQSKILDIKVTDIPHKPTNCQVHEDEILKFYCETCSSLICRDCMAIEHSGHAYNRLEKVVEKEKDDLLSMLGGTDLDGIKANLDNAVAKGSKVMQQFQKNRKPVEELIDSAYAALTDVLLKRKEALLEKVRGIKTQMAVQTKRFCTLQKEIVDTYDMITTASRAYTPEELLSVKGAMTKNLGLLLEQYETIKLEPCVSDMVSSKLDTSELIKKIDSYGLVVVGSSPEKAETDFYVCRAVEGKEKRITITTYDVHGERFSYGGERVKVTFGSEHNSWYDVEGQVIDNNDGTYVASFTPNASSRGEFKLRITFDGQHIRGSPFDVYVRYNRDYKQVSSCSYVFSLAFQSSPYDVAVDDSGGVYVANYNRGFIEVFDSKSEYQIRTIGMTNRNTGYGNFKSPSAIAIQGHVLYVAEDKCHQVQKLTTSGDFIAKFGSHGSGDGQLNQPRGLCVHKDGRIFVSDSGNKRVSVFKPDGTFLYHILTVTGNYSNLNYPQGLAFDHCGNLHISFGNNWIKIFTSSGQHIAQYSSMVEQSAGIAIDDEGNIFIAGRHLCILDSKHQVILNQSLNEGVQYYMGVAVDKNGLIYLCAYNEGKIYRC